MDSASFIIQLLDKAGGTICGRVQLQKLVYFCKAMGADINANYKLYIYGPFSQQVANALQDCVADDILVETEGAIRKGKDFDSILQKIYKSEDALPDITNNIVHDILDQFRHLTTKQIEIDATTFFINRQQNALYGKSEKATVLNMVSKAKGTRFSPEEIESSYNRMVSIFLPIEKKYIDTTA